MIKNYCKIVDNVVEVYVTRKNGTKHVILMDLEDFETINEMQDISIHVDFAKSVNSFYARYKDGDNKTKQLHRLIMDTSRGLVVDHINHNTLDNRRCNLRNATTRENGSNLKRKSELSSQYVGVSWFKRDEKWEAKIQINGKSKHLGYFSTELEASQAYLQAKNQIAA